MNPIQTVFPKYSAAATQIGVHGKDAYVHGRAVASAPTNGERLDSALRAANDFDHAVTSSKDIPVGRVFTPVNKYYQGYAAAKAAATMIIGSGAVPGARERVGLQEILAARDEFHTGLKTYDAKGDSKYGRYLATDWLDASLEDGAAGVAMLRKNDLAQPLVQGLVQTRTAVQNNKPVPADTVKRVDDLFAQAQTSFDELIAKAEEAFQKSGQEPAPLVEIPKHILHDMQP